MSKTFFQIGTNNGNDNFRKKVIDERPSLVILVEPNSSLVSEIRKNYGGIDNVFIYNNAIYYNNDEDIELYIPSKNGIPGQVADNGIIYSDAHFSLVPMNDWGNKDDMVKIVTKSITFDEICRRHSLREIDYLQIDTEGFDSEIIKMIDFSMFRIKKMRFEKWLFDSEKFTNFNPGCCNELGISGFKIVTDKLKKFNYTLNEINDDDGNDIIATLNE